MGKRIDEDGRAYDKGRSRREMRGIRKGGIRERGRGVKEEGREEEGRERE